MTQQPMIENASYLGAQEKALARDLYETSTAPLGDYYNKAVKGKIEDLSSRGVLYGGLGSEALKDLFVQEGKQRSDIAGQIATSVGQTALERAYNSNENALARAFQKEQTQTQLAAQKESQLLGIGASKESQLSQQQFQTGLTQTQLAAQKESQLLGIGAQEKSQLSQQAFQTGLSEAQLAAQKESQLSQQAFQGGLSQAQLAAQKESQLSQQAFQTGQTQAQIDAQKASQLLSIQAGKESEANQQQFQLAFQNAGFIQQDKLSERASQAQNNIMAMQMALEGNLGGEAVQQLVEKTFGKGFNLTTNDEADLKRAAASVGLTPDEFTKTRQAIAKGQLADMFTDSREYIDGQTTERYISGYEKYVSGKNYGEPDYSKPIYSERPVAGKVKNPNYGKPYVDGNGQQTINPDYIDTPEKARAFQKELANIYANAQIKSAEASGGKVICSELYKQGYIPAHIYISDALYAKLIDTKIVTGYQAWGIPLVKVMKKSKLVTNIVKPFGVAWAHHMAYILGVTKKENYFGLILEAVGMPICYLIGTFMKKGSENGSIIRLS